MNVSSALAFALEGHHPWGTLDVANPVDLARRGWGEYRLRVYPPGTNAAERRALTFHRRWPVCGGIAALFAELILGTLWVPSVVTVIILSLYFSGIAVGLAGTRGLRQQVRSITVVVTELSGERHRFGDVALYEASVRHLLELDRRMSAGEIVHVQHEAGWAVVYNSLESMPLKNPRLRFSL
ncbi:DUF6611 family protein [Lacisediminihabitans changchengi]|uniref:Uncharacterized protein n=1 Tax=Lacisediminihabitans changchengi TaxID=2787634 RepID=A0A934SIQ3_9MICO|nr:DUF6611 family protein [Lacisediminihabitans changchengi]MBK4346119.1 hypothetical protein [Lacisediminihabitans changchengi]